MTEKITEICHGSCRYITSAMKWVRSFFVGFAFNRSNPKGIYDFNRFALRLEKAFRVTPAVTKVDSLLRATSI